MKELANYLTILRKTQHIHKEMHCHGISFCDKKEQRHFTQIYNTYETFAEKQCDACSSEWVRMLDNE